MSHDASGSILWRTRRLWQTYQGTFGAVTGFMLGGLFGHHARLFFWNAEIEWGIVGTIIGILSVHVIRFVSNAALRPLIGGTLALVFTLLFLHGWHNLTGFLLESAPLVQNFFSCFGLLFLPLLSWKLGTRFAESLLDSPSPGAILPSPDAPSKGESPRLLDSSSIIDGRILSLCKTGFLQGRFLVPQCILNELLFLADSPNPDKRVRGKRGLDILSQLRSLSHISVVIPEIEPQPALPVDQQLLNLAGSLKGTIITNDWNMAQIAGLQGTNTLNINELTYELRPLVLPGQTIRVFIQKEGQGPGQGAAHLDDGTLVIIDNGNHLIGRSVDVQVSRYMQTNTGRMIFASLVEAQVVVSST